MPIVMTGFDFIPNSVVNYDAMPFSCVHRKPIATVFSLAPDSILDYIKFTNYYE